MEWFEATTEEKQGLSEEIKNSVIKEGYNLTFNDLKKETGLTIKSIKNDYLYKCEMAKFMSGKSSSVLFFPGVVPFEFSPREIDEDFRNKGVSKGEYCATLLLIKGPSEYSTETLFNQSALNKLKESLKDEDSFENNIKDFEDEFEDSESPFEI